MEISIFWLWTSKLSGSKGVEKKAKLIVDTSQSCEHFLQSEY